MKNLNQTSVAASGLKTEMRSNVLKISNMRGGVLLLLASIFIHAKMNAQFYNPNDWGDMLQYGIISGANINSADTVYVFGKAGSVGTVSGPILTDSLFQNAGGNVISALADLDTLRSLMFSQGGIPFNNTTVDTVLSPGVYNINGNQTFQNQIYLDFSSDTLLYIFNVTGNIHFDSTFNIYYDTDSAHFGWIVWNVQDSAIINGNLKGVLMSDYTQCSTTRTSNLAIWSVQDIVLSSKGELNSPKWSVTNPAQTCDIAACGNLISNFDFNSSVDLLPPPPNTPTNLLFAHPFGFAPSNLTSQVPCWEYCTPSPQIQGQQNSQGAAFMWAITQVNPQTQIPFDRCESIFQNLLQPLIPGNKYLFAYDFRAPLRQASVCPFCSISVPSNFVDRINLQIYSTSAPTPPCQVTSTTCPSIAPNGSTVQNLDILNIGAPIPDYITRNILLQVPLNPANINYGRLYIYPTDNDLDVICNTSNHPSSSTPIRTNRAWFNITNLRLYEITAGADALLECGNSTLLGCANTDIQQAFPTAQFTWTLGGNVVGTGPTLSVNHSNNTAAPITLTYTLTVTVPGAAGLASISDDVEITLDPNPMSGTLTLSGLAPVCNPSSTYTIDQYNPNITYTITCDNGTIQNQSGANFDVVWNDLNGGTIFIQENSNQPCQEVTQIVVQGCCPIFTFDESTNNGTWNNATQLANILGIAPNPFVFSGLTLEINQPFIVDDFSVFADCNIVLGPQASITIVGGINAAFAGTYLHSCSGIWTGIITQAGSSLNFRQSVIEDANIAVSINSPTTFFESNTSIFNKNFIGVQITHNPGFTGSPQVEIINTAFACNELNFDPNTLNQSQFTTLISSYINSFQPVAQMPPNNNQNWGFAGIICNNLTTWDLPSTNALNSFPVSDFQNYFVNHTYHVYSNRSGMRVRRNFFDYTVNPTPNPNYTSNMNFAGVAVYNRPWQNGQTRNIIIGDQTNSANGNVFNNCIVGVGLNTNVNNGIFNNQFIGNTYDVNLQSMAVGSNSLVMLNTSNQNTRTAVFGRDIRSNTNISGNTLANANNRGIFITNPQINYVNTSIRSNTISGQNLLLGIHCNSVPGVSIQTNNISFNNTVSAIASGSSRIGIDAQNCDKVSVISNTITRNGNGNFTPFNFTSLTGISVATSLSSVVCQNQTNGMGAGLSFTGGCAQSRINLNQMNGDFLGVQLLGANIAAGWLVPTVPGDNEWNGIVGLDRIAGSIIGANHDWLYNQNNAIMNPNPHNVFGFPFTDQPVNPNQNPYTANCGNFSVRSEGLNEDEYQLDIHLMLSIANRILQYGTNDSASTYKLFDDLFFLQECEYFDSTILSLAVSEPDYVMLQNYRLVLADSFAGKAFMANKNIDQTEFGNASVYLNQLTPQHTAEQILKFVLEIKLNIYSRDSLFLLPEEIEILEPIANSDAVFYGPGVYIARALLALVGENQSKTLKIPIPIAPDIPQTKKVWPCPNPNNGTLSFCKNFNCNENFRLDIYNLYGHVVVSVPIYNFNSTQLDISYLPSGAYYFKISNGIESFKGSFILTIKN